jgi:hypothetical protein
MVTEDGNDVTVSFTVSGGKGSGADFTINYRFDRDKFAGWIPNGPAIA